MKDLYNEKDKKGHFNQSNMQNKIKIIHQFTHQLSLLHQ